MNKLVIAGSGGFAGEVEWLVKRINSVSQTWDFLGFVDNDLSSPNAFGNDEFLINYPNEIYVSIAIGTSEIRERIYKRYQHNPNIRFANLIDPSAIISDKVTIGEGNIICAGSIITVGITIGNCSIVNLDCTIGHEATIRDFVTINPSVNVSGNVTIEKGCNIGTGTQIIQGIRIGKNAVVGAGAVVNRDLLDNCTAVGIPAKVIKIREVTSVE